MRPLFHCAKNDRKQPKEEEEAGSDFTHSNFPPLFRASGARVSMTLQFAAIHRSTQNAFGRSPPPPIVACSDARQPDGVRAVQRPARTDSFAPLITRQGEHPVRQTVAALYTYDGPLSLFLSCQPKKRQSGRKRSHMEKNLSKQLRNSSGRLSGQLQKGRPPYFSSFTASESVAKCTRPLNAAAADERQRGIRAANAILKIEGRRLFGTSTVMPT